MLSWRTRQDLRGHWSTEGERGNDSGPIDMLWGLSSQFIPTRINFKPYLDTLLIEAPLCAGCS